MNLFLRSSWVYSALCLLSLGLTACAGKIPPNAPPSETPMTISIPMARANNAFTINLLKTLQADGTKNLFFSPASVFNLMALSYQGAKGQTAQEISQALHLPPSLSELAAFSKEMNSPVTLLMANSVWVNQSYPLKNSFKESAQQTFNAEIQNLDFQSNPEGSRQTINHWVENKTQHRITDLIPAGTIQGDLRVILANAIYFKGDWLTPFQANQTTTQPFFDAVHNQPPSLPPLTTLMMTHQDYFRYTESPETQIVELPYKGNSLSMVVILPKQSHTITSITQALTLNQLEAWIKSLRSQKVRVTLPKFQMKDTLLLGSTLQKVGIHEAFNAHQADFSGMDGTRSLYLSEIIHKAFIQVDEMGTEAAAASAIVMDGAHYDPSPVIIFNANHPFLFLIRDNASNAILFMGQLVQP